MFLRPRSRHRNRATGVASLLVLGVGLTALFLGYNWFWIVFVVGFAVFVPLVSVLTGESESADEDESTPESVAQPAAEDDPLATLRRRYARGELTEAQFERKLETLLETETLEAVEDRDRRRTDEALHDHERDADRETSRE